MSSNFRFTAGRLSLWLTATVGNRGSQPFERLLTPDDLSQWCVQAKLVDVPPSVSMGDLETTRMLREAIYRLMLARIQHVAIEAGDREMVNYWAAQMPLAPQLNADGQECVWIADQPLKASLAMIARDAITLITGPEADRLKICAQPVCAMLFLDTSHSGQRRWCSMNVCGNRAKKLNYRKGHS